MSLQNKLYLDGCSFTYGVGLDDKAKLSTLLTQEAGFSVTNNARPGKSNLAIALDIHRNANTHDVIVAGWTFSDRFYLESRDSQLDFLPTRHIAHIDDDYIGENLEEVYAIIHKQLYTIHDNHFYDDLSDMLINGIYSDLRRQGKKVIFFSWENRKTSIDMFYPIIKPELRLDDGHLNEKGMQKLYEDITCLYEKTK